METRTIIGLGAVAAVGAAAWFLWPRDGAKPPKDGTKPPPKNDGTDPNPWAPDPAQVAKACDLERQITALSATRAQLVAERQGVYTDAWNRCNGFASPCVGVNPGVPQTPTPPQTGRNTPTEWVYYPTKGGGGSRGCEPPGQQYSVRRCREYVDGTAPDLPLGGSGTLRAELQGLREKMADLKKRIGTVDNRLSTLNADLAKLRAQKIVCTGGK